ncbi:hypothetical protein VTJ83DRAFT_1868 [Remersonia thermophila]|uniref:Uncharacterized protein n=1 Tax=Remersonia thermophila TaxID=72144 RepID=A0ABR4DJE6_9PEZI
MFKTTIRAGAWRSRFRASSRFLNTRGYATMQERIAMSSERQWQIAAVAVTIPGLMYLRGGSNRRPEPTPSNMTQTMQQMPGKVRESPMAQQAVRTMTQTTPKQQFEAAVEKTQEVIDKSKETAKEMLASAGGGSSASSEPSGQAEAQAKPPEDTA